MSIDLFADLHRPHCSERKDEFRCHNYTVCMCGKCALHCEHAENPESISLMLTDQIMRGGYSTLVHNARRQAPAQHHHYYAGLDGSR